MALEGQATMVAIYDLEAGWEAKHDDWHSHEHMEERVGIPGFLRGRRYLADGKGTRCFVFYEAESLEALISDDYFERLNNPTSWSSELMPHFRNMTRTLCRITVTVGKGTGGKMSYVPLSPKPGQAKSLRNWIAKTIAPLGGQQGILGAHLLEGDDEASRIQTREKELRGGDEVADWLLLLEGYDFPDSIFEKGPLQQCALLENGASMVGEITNYTLGAILMEAEI